MLEDLSIISLSDLSFTLPENIEELQQYLGGEGACIQVGYSLIDYPSEGDFFLILFH